MLEAINYKGEWFLPENTDNKISGVLTFDGKNDAILELFGVLGNSMDDGFNARDFILGITVEGKHITLYNTYEYSKIVTNGIPSSKYSSLNIIIGHHYYSEEDFKFFKVEANFKNLNKWVDKYGFKINNPFNRNNHTINLEYNKPESIQFDINDKLKGEIDFWYKLLILIILVKLI